MIQIPDTFFRGTAGREGARGEDWLATLPQLVTDLMGRWDCVADGPVTHGGVGLIVPVRRPDADQRSAVLKVSFPHPGNVAEPDAFEAWDGRGAVRLYARDDAHFAMLLERAHSSTLAEVSDSDEVARIAGELHRRLTIPAPSGLPRLSDQVGEWEESLLRDARELTHDLPPRSIDAAVATLRELGREQPELVVHGDFHARNILRAEREPWLVVDPKGYVGDPAYDGAPLLGARVRELAREDDFAKAAMRMLEIFAETAGLELERVVRWAGYRAVESALWGRRHGFRAARSGSGRDLLVELLDELVATLT
jgi:streptomycin 6-kinase